MDTRRKRVKHYHEPGDCHELTFSCYRRLPLLKNDSWCRMLSESVDRAMSRYSFRLVAFVFMPEHVHLLVLPTTVDVRIDRLLSAIKRPFSYRIKQQLIESESPMLKTLTVRERPGMRRFRFWQEGAGYDRNINKERTVQATIDYIHLNPVRRGLCERAIDWPWSSARHYQQSAETIDEQLPRIEGLPPESLIDARPKD